MRGRWSFASGSLHATWLGLGGHVYDGDAPRLGPDGQPDWRFFHVPKREAMVLDTWHVTGLRGTGSNDVVVEDVFVPAHRTRTAAFPAPEHAAPLYAFGPGLLSLTCAAVALAIARGMLDALAYIAATKVPRAGGGVLLRDQPVAHYRIGIAEAQVRGARALLLNLTREVWAEATQGTYLSERNRALMTWASAHATAMAAQAVDTAWDLAGGTAVSWAAHSSGASATCIWSRSSSP